jgi:hypothetical protein
MSESYDSTSEEVREPEVMILTDEVVNSQGCTMHSTCPDYCRQFGCPTLR